MMTPSKRTTPSKPSLRHSVIYQIFIDRFNGEFSGDWQRPKFHGGNLKGVIEKIRYLKELGVTGIWLSPFYKTSAYHGYHPTDFYKVDPRFGTLTDIKKLIRLAHKNDIRIFADLIPNHCSHKHPYFKKAQRDEKSPYTNWFYFTKWPDEYLCFLHFKELPKLNLDYRETYNHIINAAKYWLSQGIDGFRLDHTAGPSHEFWRSFTKDVKTEYPKAILFGEAAIFGVTAKDVKSTLRTDKRWSGFLEQKLTGKSESIQRSYKGILDGVLDFTTYRYLKGFIAKKGWYKPKWLLRLLLKWHFRAYDDTFLPLLFLDNHDVQRFLFEAGSDTKRLKEAAGIMFDLPFPKVLYQGTERGMSQKKPFSAFKKHSDLLAREPIDWNRYDKGIFKFFKKKIREAKKER